MTAYRFFRKDKVPIVKQKHPDLDGKGRQQLIKKWWREMNDEDKYPYVCLSRADREKAVYVTKLNQIRMNFLRAHPRLKEEDSDIVNKHIESQI